MNGPLTFRKDITFVEQDDDNGHKTIVLKNPVSETFFRLSDYEFRLIKQFDGKRSLQQVLETLRGQGLSYEPKHAEAILAKASSAGLMMGSPISDSDYLANLRQRMNQANRLRKYLSPISLYVPLGNPDRLLDRWLWIFNTLFSRYTLILWVSLGLYSVYVISGSLTRIQTQHLALMNAWDLLMLWPAIAASRLVHEMGHALVAKRYGVRVRTIGIALLFLFPLPYCDTTDAWRLKSQRQRIWIGAAGIAGEMILACICSLIWFFSKPGTLNYLAFYIFSVSTVSTIVFNANPLLKFDGYFILSDYLRMPNLASKSQNYVKSLILEKLLGLSGHVVADVKPKRPVILISYGILSFCYRMILSVAILSALYYRFGKVIGLILVGYAAVVLFIRPVMNGLKAMWADEAKSQIFQRRPIRLGLVGLILVMALCWPWSNRTAFHCRADSNLSQAITVPLSTSVSDVFIRQGSRLAKGDVMFELDFTRAEFELKKAGIEREALHLQLKALLLDREGLSKAPQKSLEITKVDEAIARMEAEVRMALNATRAPFDCLVTQLDKKMKAGFQPGEGVVVGHLKSTSSRVATAHLPDRLLGKLNGGQSVRVWFPLGAGYMFSSTLSIVKDFGESTSSHREQALLAGHSRYSSVGPDHGTDRAIMESQTLYRCMAQLPDDSPVPLGMSGSIVIEFPSQNSVSRLYQYAVQTMNRESFL